MTAPFDWDRMTPPVEGRTTEGKPRDTRKRVRQGSRKSLPNLFYRQRASTSDEEVETSQVKSGVFFVSYARDSAEDQEGVQRALETVKKLGYRIRVDRERNSGQAWWDIVLGEIRTCDAMLVFVSPALLNSLASTLERRYAQELGRPLLPIIIRPLPADRLPQDLASRQFVDYTASGLRAESALAEALASLPAPAALPDPLPAPPPVPTSYLSGQALKESYDKLTDVAAALFRRGSLTRGEALDPEIADLLLDGGGREAFNVLLASPLMTKRTDGRADYYSDEARSLAERMVEDHEDRDTIEELREKVRRWLLVNRQYPPEPRIARDYWTTQDGLNYAAYADAIAAFIRLHASPTHYRDQGAVGGG